MIRAFSALVIGLLLAACSTVPVPVRHETGTPWQQMARADLEFIHQTIARHHPGPVDEMNPAFRTWFEDGYLEALAKVPDVKGFGAYQHVLRYYVQGFADEHLGLNFWLDFRWHQWAGIVLAWNGAAFELRRAAEDVDLAAGALLEACDGRSAESLWQSNVAPFYARAELPANRFRHAPRLLLSNGNPLVERPTSCTFVSAGERVEFELRWRGIQSAELQRELSAGAPQDRVMGLRDFGGSGAWLTLPTFGPQGEAAEALKSTLAALASYRDADFVVVDVRGNGGGSSYWAEPFVRGLYGDAFFERLSYELRQRQTGLYVDHRVSADNLAHFESLLPVIGEQAGEDSEMYRYFAGLVEGMQAALDKGEALFPVQRDDATMIEPPPAEPAFRGRLVYLTDSVCVSACLDFSDVVMALPRVTHVGQPTSADTTYMEIRGATLPSNIGTLNFATKVYRGLSRGETGYYTPEIPYVGDVSDTPRVESWLLGGVLAE
jgi:hypothetical protein